MKALVSRPARVLSIETMAAVHDASTAGNPANVPPPRGPTKHPFHLAAGDLTEADTSVVRFRGKEGISRLFRFDVDFKAAVGRDLSREPLVGRAATFTFGFDTPRRAIRGVVESLTLLGTDLATGAMIGRVRIVPPLALGRRRVASRVFQNLDVRAVATSVCAPPAGTTQSATDAFVVGTYPPREYCVQYQASDWAFFQRILAEEGIWFHFEHATDADTAGSAKLVLMDDAASYPRLDPPLAVRVPTRNDDGARRKDVVRAFQLRHRMRSNALRLKDYDFQRPLLDLQASTSVPNGTLVAAFESGEALQVDRYRAEYLAPEADLPRATRELDQQRRRAFEGIGEGSADKLVPGYRFDLADEDTPANDGEYVVTEIEHEGLAAEYAALDDLGRVYTNRFRCVPSAVPYRPKRPERRPVQVMESAVVVGKDKGTVLTDAFGRIRVQFPWDYQGTYDERSTTWLRVVQGWAGPSFGLQFIPRVGMEVMVTFLGGDVDCPVVVGAIHNGANPHPFHLPDQATRSGLRTETTPGGQGFNELSFEDAAGLEQVYLHAQRDLDVDVARNHTLQVKRTQHVTVGDAQTISIRGNQDEVVGGMASRTVESDEMIELGASRSTGIKGSDVTAIGEERRARVGSNDETEVVGQADWTVGQDLTIRTGGAFTTIVGKQGTERSFTLHVEGVTDLFSKEITEIASSKGIRLRAGESVVEIMPDHVEIASPKILLRAPDARVTVDHDQLLLFAKKDARVQSEDHIGLASAGASLGMKSEVQVSGSQILLNSPDRATDPPPPDPKKPAVLVVKDRDGNPLANGRCVLVDKDGWERSVVLDADGRAEVHGLDKTVQVRFPGATEPS